MTDALNGNVDDPEETAQLIQSVVDFTGCSHERAAELLATSHWNVPEAVTRFFHESERDAPNRVVTNSSVPPSSWTVLLTSIASSIKRCFGPAFWACWNMIKLLIVGPSWSHRRSGAKIGRGSLSHRISGGSSSLLDCSFAQALALSRARDNRKVLLMFLHDSESIDFDHYLKNVLGDPAVAQVISTQFLMWTGDTGFQEPEQVRRLLPLKTTPILAALISVNATEIKVVGICGGSAFTVENVLTLLQRAQEAQDELIAQDEQFKVNRSLREEQDMEYLESLKKDKEAQEIKRREQEDRERKLQEKIDRKEQIRENRQMALRKVLRNSVPEGTTEFCTIVVRLPGGKRIDRKFPTRLTVDLLYDWVFCSGLLHPDVCPAWDKITEDNFVLSTAFPSAQITDKTKTFQDYGLVPNAVLSFAFTCDVEDLSDLDN